MGRLVRAMGSCPILFGVAIASATVAFIRCDARRPFFVSYSLVSAARELQPTVPIGPIRLILTRWAQFHIGGISSLPGQVCRITGIIRQPIRKADRVAEWTTIDSLFEAQVSEIEEPKAACN